MKGGARALFTFTDSLRYYSFLAQNYKDNSALISWRFRSIFCPSYGVSSPSYPSSCFSSLASSKVNTISYLFKHSVYAMKNGFNMEYYLSEKGKKFNNTQKFSMSKYYKSTYPHGHLYFLDFHEACLSFCILANVVYE